MYSEPSRTSRIEPFTKIVKGQKPLTIFAKSSFVDVRMGSEYASGGINEPARHLHFDKIELTDVNIISDKVFKNGPSKICGRQPLKNLKGYGLLSHMMECIEIY